MYNNYGQPYFGSQTMPRYQQPMEQTMPMVAQPYTQQNLMAKPTGLLGKSVDSIEVVKATDIPLDGSISYFPLADGSAIVTKQLQPDGVSKTIVYKPVVENENNSQKFVTLEELKKEISNIDIPDIDDLKDDIKDLRKQIKDIKGKGS